MNEIIEWLRSCEGQAWSSGRTGYYGNASRHETGIFGSLKPDIEYGDGWAVRPTAFSMIFPENEGENMSRPATHVVSTACPACGTRFAMLARYDRAGWHLHCTSCGWSGTGELKT